MSVEGFLCAASENTFFHPVLLRCGSADSSVFLATGSLSRDGAPKPGAAIRYCCCLFFNFHIISSVEWKQAAPCASDLTPGQCLCWIQQSAESGESVLCWKTLPALLIPSVFPTYESARFVLWFCTELQQLPAVRGSGQQASSAPSHLGCFHQPFPLDPPGSSSWVVPVLAVPFGIEAGCQLSVAAVGRTKKINGKLGELVVLLCVNVVEHDLSFWWRWFWLFFWFFFRVGLNIWY